MFRKMAPAFAVCLAIAGCSSAASDDAGKGHHASYGPRAEAAAPQGAMVLHSSDPNLAGVIADAPEGATLYFASGIYSDLQIEPKAGQRFIGELGARLRSQTKTYAFACFDRPVENVTIENLVIDGYLPPVQAAAISGGKNWRVKNCEVRNSAAGGIQLRDGSTVENCYIHRCQQLGIKLFGQSPILRHCEIANNNPDHKYDVFWEAGGSKFWQTTDILIEDNYFHDNVGNGIWLDCDNTGIVRANRCDNNTLAGIYQEIGGQLVIEDNTCTNDGTEYKQAGWLHGAGITVEASQNVTVRKNTIRGCANGVGIIATSRGEDRWTIKDIVVIQNTISMAAGRTGVVWDEKAPAPWDEVHFAENWYTLAEPDMFAWQPGTISYHEWQAAGEDRGSTFTLKR